MILPQNSDYGRLFLDQIPMLDVRSPIEFGQGAFPLAVNFPLLTDEERHLVGICYKQSGQASAIELGHQLVCGEIKQSRLDGWLDYFKRNPNAVLYCFRGGLRSRTVQQWIYEAFKLEIPRVTGGYKALRRFLINHSEEKIASIKPFVLGGRTGSGKTPFLKRISLHIDLEGHANHRGSAFGQCLTPQPTQIDFENLVAVDLLKNVSFNSPVLFEDEGRAVGSVHLPLALFTKLRSAPLIILESTKEERIETIFNEYVVQRINQLNQLHGCVGNDSMTADIYLQDMLEKLGRIQRRLGGDRFNQLSLLLQEAHKNYLHTGSLDLHRHWIIRLLEDYYDPMYDYQISERKNEICFRGNQEQVSEFLAKNEFVVS